MNRVTHFEIPADDMQRASAFYKKVFGWQFNEWEGQPYWLINTGDSQSPGINGRMMKKRDPMQQVVNSINVKNIDEAIRSVEQNGGKIVVPKTMLPGAGWLAYFKDTEENIFGIMQEDTNAK